MQPKDKVTFNSKKVGPGSARSVVQLSHGKTYTIGEVDYGNQSLRLVEDPSGNWHSMKMFQGNDVWSPFVIEEKVIFNSGVIPTGVSGCILPTHYAEAECSNGHVYTISAVAPGNGIRLRDNGARYYNPEQFTRYSTARVVAVKPVKAPEILGWNVKEQFKSAAQKLKFFKVGAGVDVALGDETHQFFKDMGVLDLWFTPVYFSPSMVQKFSTQFGSIVRIGKEIRIGEAVIVPEDLMTLANSLSPTRIPKWVSGFQVSDPVIQITLGGHKLNHSEIIQILDLHEEYRARL